MIMIIRLKQAAIPYAFDIVTVAEKFDIWRQNPLNVGRYFATVPLGMPPWAAEATSILPAGPAAGQPCWQPADHRSIHAGAYLAAAGGVAPPRTL